MAYVIECLDRPGGLPLRLEVRPVHLDYLTGFNDRILVAGPLLDEAGNPMGSLLVVDFASAAEAKEFSDNDPYAKAGLFASVSIRPFRKVFPQA